MKIVLNGNATEIPDGLTIAKLVAHLGLDEGPVAVERNLEVVPRKEHGTALVLEGDAIEIVHFVGGG